MGKRTLRARDGSSNECHDSCGRTAGPAGKVMNFTNQIFFVSPKVPSISLWTITPFVQPIPLPWELLLLSISIKALLPWD